MSALLDHCLIPNCSSFLSILAEETMSFSLLYGPITLDFEAVNAVACDFWIHGFIIAASRAKSTFSLSAYSPDSQISYGSY